MDKEYAVGKKFKTYFGDIFRVVKNISDDRCEDCFFIKSNYDCPDTECRKEHRKDNTAVVFKDVSEECD